MRFGAPLFGDVSDPGAWVRAVQAHGYTAAYCPVGGDADDTVCRAYSRAADAAGIVIAEVGAWSNPLSTNDGVRAAAVAHCQTQLALADRIGARCCVNISGSCGTQWDGPDPLNLTPDTFDRIVETTRAIIDAVKPARAYYALETMPWAYPDSPESYLRLIEAIGRDRFAVHLDPVNLISSPQRFFENGAFIRQCFQLLGPHIRSCHAKDVTLSGKLTVHLDETRPGTGGLDYPVFLRELSRLPPDTTLMLEHLPSAEEYGLAAAHVRAVALAEGIAL